MNVRTVRMMAIAIAMCVVTAAATNASAKDKPKHGSIADISLPKAAAGTTAAVAGSIKITEIDKASKAETTNSYELSDAVSVQVNGEPAKLEDLAKGDKIAFSVTDGKIARIMKGHKAKKPQ